MLIHTNALKAVPCMDCGGRFPPYVMDFDHRDGAAKSMEISNIIRRGWSWQKLAREIALCDIVCANCHRIRTFKRQQYSGHRNGTVGPETPDPQMKFPFSPHETS